MAGAYSAEEYEGKTKVQAFNMSGKQVSKVIDMPFIEFLSRYQEWQVKDLLIQDAFPTLSSEDREFLLTGTTTDEWNKLFKE